jgi:hypothetical protein
LTVIVVHTVKLAFLTQLSNPDITANGVDNVYTPKQVSVMTELITYFNIFWAIQVGFETACGSAVLCVPTSPFAFVRELGGALSRATVHPLCGTHHETAVRQTKKVIRSSAGVFGTVALCVAACITGNVRAVVKDAGVLALVANGPPATG